MQPRAAHLTVRKNGEFSCFQVEMKWGKPMYIFTCRDVWRLGGWCDKVSGCYWPEMTVKAVFANFTATSPDICLLLLRSPSLPRLRHPQRQFEKTNISKTKTLPTAQVTQGIECFDSINTFISKQKLQQSLKSWSNFSLCFVCCSFALHPSPD